MPEPTRFNDDKTADAYQRLLLPRIFIPWAQLLLDKAGLKPGQRVLDLATGPGTVARLAALRVGPQGTVTGADLSPNMLAQAQAKPPVPGGAPLTYVQAPADALPFEAASFDAVLIQQGLQFFPDQPKALLEIRRVLKPGGSLTLAAWAGIESMPLFDSFHRSLEVAQGYSSNLPPLQWFAPARLRQLLQDAGFSAIQAELASLAAEFPAMADALACAEAMSNAPAVRALTPQQRAHFDALVTAALQPFRQGESLRIPVGAVLGRAQA